MRQSFATSVTSVAAVACSGGAGCLGLHGNAVSYDQWAHSDQRTHSGLRLAGLPMSSRLYGRVLVLLRPVLPVLLDTTG